MDETTLLYALIGVAFIGIVATLAIVYRSSAASRAAAGESQFATSTEGMTRCPACGTGNLVTDATCSNCGKRLPG